MSQIMAAEAAAQALFFAHAAWRMVPSFRREGTIVRRRRHAVRRERAPPRPPVGAGQAASSGGRIAAV